jgi:hypothetical protein
MTSRTNEHYNQSVDRGLSQAISDISALNNMLWHVESRINDAWTESPLLHEEDIRGPMEEIEKLCRETQKRLEAQVQLLLTAENNRTRPYDS